MLFIMECVRMLLSWHRRCKRTLRDLAWRDTGQTTAEYALVLLGAAAVALLLIAWVTGSGKIGELFDVVFNNIIGKAR